MAKIAKIIEKENKTTTVNLEEIIKVKNEIINDLENKLDVAYKEQEQMLVELKTWLNLFPSAFRQLIEHAGKITPEDVNYHTNLLIKIMEHKFGYKSKTEN